MRLEAEGRQAIDKVTPSRLKTAIARLRTYGPCSYATLIDVHGNFLQVAGGRVTCMMERRDVGSDRHYRAYQSKRSEVFADGTTLVFGAGKIEMSADEWFIAADVEETFLAFLVGDPLPERIGWRDITATLRWDSA